MSIEAHPAQEMVGRKIVALRSYSSSEGEVRVSIGATGIITGVIYQGSKEVSGYHIAWDPPAWSASKAYWGLPGGGWKLMDSCAECDGHAPVGDYLCEGCRSMLYS